jgi:hypothetical protein
MIKIAHKTEAENLKHIQSEISARVVEIATILDENYQRERDVEHDLGGYILIAETTEDVEAITSSLRPHSHQPNSKPAPLTKTLGGREQSVNEQAEKKDKHKNKRESSDVTVLFFC